jgi:predicted MFS family arabinose efflux permease
MGLFQTIYSLGMFIGPVIMGVMLQHINLPSGYLFIAALSVVAVVITPLSVRWVNNRQVKPDAELSPNGQLASARDQ